MRKKDDLSRDIFALAVAIPRYEPVLKAWCVRVNTLEALTLVVEGRAPFRSREKDGQKAQIYFYNGKRYIWSAGITTDSFGDDLPARVVKPGLAQVA